MRVYRGVPFKTLKAVQVCSNMFVRTLVTSDTLFTPKTLPRDLDLPVTNNRDIELDYDWHAIPPPGAAAKLPTPADLPAKGAMRSSSEMQENRDVPPGGRLPTPRTALAGVPGNVSAGAGMPAPALAGKGGGKDASFADLETSLLDRNQVGIPFLDSRLDPSPPTGARFRVSGLGMRVSGLGCRLHSVCKAASRGRGLLFADTMGGWGFGKSRGSNSRY